MTDIAGERTRLTAQGLDIVTRERWGARQPYTSDRRVNRPASWLFLHISVTADPADTPDAEAAACRTVEAIGQQRFGIGCSYNAGAMQSGRLYEMQPLTRRGAHTVNDLVNPAFPEGSLNYDARALVLVQNVQDAVTDAQIDAAARWGAALCRSGEARPGARWFGHRDVTQKSCPGDKGYARLAELNALTRHYETNGLEDDMPLTEEDKAWHRELSFDRRDEVVKAVDESAVTTALRLGMYLAGNMGNAALNPQLPGREWMADAVTLPQLAALVKGIDPPDVTVDVDEIELAAALAPLITSQTQSLSDADLAAIAKAVNDEQHRRSAE